MALISIIEDFHPMNNARLLDQAAVLRPTLHHRIKEPVGGFQLKERYSYEKEDIVLQQLPQLAMGKGQNLCLDFGTHYVGYLTLELSYTGSHPDAPAFLKLKFAETFKELSENSQKYDGWISSSWIQEEYIHVDELPAKISLPRRYAFRYLKITMMDTSPKYKLVVKHAECMTETSADIGKMIPVTTKDPMLNKIDAVGLRTLANCMQNEFEDGPKRDRRLWMGDLRLQALTNYCSFHNNDLVKRCLYLFAGSRFPDGRISACIFTSPNVEADDTYLFEYSLFFPVALDEYLQQTNDTQALDELYDIAMQQIEIALYMVGPDNIVNETAIKKAFIDWCDGLDKEACAQAALIYALRYARRLARRKNDWSQANWISGKIEKLTKAAYEKYWDAEKGCFVSNGQISTSTQVWMVLADVLSPEKATKLMEHAIDYSHEYKMVTPYMHHYYVMALLRCGLKEQAFDHIRSYWGSMIEAGADTFYEAWNPEDREASPYGSSVINSYCHAWSCTPSYIIRNFYEDN